MRLISIAIALLMFKTARRLFNAGEKIMERHDSQWPRKHLAGMRPGAVSKPDMEFQ